MMQGMQKDMMKQKGGGGDESGDGGSGGGRGGRGGGRGAGAPQTVDAPKLVESVIDGLTYEVGIGTPFTGVVVYKYGSGQKKSEATYKDGKKVSETKWDKEGNEIK